MTRTFNPSIWEAEAGGSLEMDACLVYREKDCLAHFSSLSASDIAWYWDHSNEQYMWYQFQVSNKPNT